MIAKLVQSFKANVRLGYAIDGNWTHPVVYVLYSLIAPISAVLLLVFMYMLVLGGSRDTSFLAFMLAGSAVFMYVRLILSGSGFAVIEDREHYGMLRYLYISPTPFPVQIFGRVMYKLLIATTGVLLTFAAGRYIMGIQFRPDGIQWGLLLLSTIAGLIGAIAIGWLLAGSMLVVDRMGWIWAEGFSGLLFMLSGAVIPLSVLPEWLRWVGLILPISYWAEAWRIALFGDAVVKALPAMDVGRLWIGLIGTTAVWSGLALGWYHLCDRIASRWGRIDTTTFY